MSQTPKDFVDSGGSRINGTRSRMPEATPLPLALLPPTGGQAMGPLGLEPPFGDAHRPKRLVDAIMTLREAAERPDPEYRSLFERGGLPLGFYGVLSGPGGIGKTREALRMIVFRVLRLRWHCWQSSTEPFRPLILSLEMGVAPVARTLERVARQIGGEDAWRSVQESVLILDTAELTQPLHAGMAATQELTRAISECGANFVLIDSLSEVKGGSGGDGPEDYAPVIAMLKTVARITSSHILVIHHNRRTPAGSRADRPEDQFRGPASFINASRWACALSPCKCTVRITWYRVSFGPVPPESYFSLDPEGIPQDEAPLERRQGDGDANREAVFDAIPAHEGISRKEVELKTGLRTSAVGDHLKVLVDRGRVARSGSGKSTTYSRATPPSPDSTRLGNRT